MKRVLVPYGTVEGMSRSVAQHVALRLREHGASVRVHDVAQLAPDFTLADYRAALTVAHVPTPPS